MTSRWFIFFFMLTLRSLMRTSIIEIIEKT